MNAEWSEAMKAEWASDVERRAALHGVLADAGRLAVVDLLSIGDASPSELAATLGMASNLLAHHVGVLQAHGVVTRNRSEGDRRRIYVHLVPGALDVSPSATLPSPNRVLFVCTANSARSHMAAALWRQASRVPVASAGTHPALAIDPRTFAAARRHSVPLRRVAPRKLDDVRQDGDLVITVCDQAHEQLGDLADTHWSVPDPVHGGDDHAFDEAFDELARRVGSLAPRLRAGAPGPPPPPPKATR